MTIALSKDVENFLEDQVRHGICADASELVNDVLRSVREQQRRPLADTLELENWLLEFADQPATALTETDFAGIRDRARARPQMVRPRRSAKRTISSPTWNVSNNGIRLTPGGRWPSDRAIRAQIRSSLPRPISWPSFRA
jgi:Arc/MetJ-type ribon-helix-helix transcriptional regulator